jgi:ADP-heptose:LPS heptosyltransferase
VSDNKNNNGSILIILIAGIGDLVLASRSLRAIRNGFKDREVYLLTSERAASLARNYEYVDHVLEFPVSCITKGKFNIIKMLKIVMTLRSINLDIVLNLYRVSTLLGGIKMGILFSAVNARKKIGHDEKGFGLFLNKKMPKETFTKQHIADAMLEIAISAGGIADKKGIEVFWDRRIERKLDGILYQKDGSRSKMLIAINPGGARKSRRWRPIYFASTANLLVKKIATDIAILGGPGEESIADTVQSHLTCNAFNIAGEITLNELVYLISKLDILITNDSAPMHIAAALGVPVIAVFGPENASLFSPYTSKENFRVLQKDIDCRPCGCRKCDKFDCLDAIKPDEVVQKCFELLENKETDALFLHEVVSKTETCKKLSR